MIGHKKPYATHNFCVDFVPPNTWSLGLVMDHLWFLIFVHGLYPHYIPLYVHCIPIVSLPFHPSERWRCPACEVWVFHMMESSWWSRKRWAFSTCFWMFTAGYWKINQLNKHVRRNTFTWILADDDSLTRWIIHGYWQMMNLSQDKEPVTWNNHTGPTSACWGVWSFGPDP